ncbi:MAG: DUF1611 domain-containing protein, partial [Ekhidna sp.]|nr:DUF1611 domain-containing protein [Ekhidna sp.]
MDQPSISGKAVIITGGLLATNNAKTAHGLLSSSNRFDIIGVIDEKHSGQDAGEIVRGEKAGVPVLRNIADLIGQVEKPDFAIIGMATKGGILPEDLYPSIVDILSQGIHVVNGLHEPLAEIQEFQEASKESGAVIHDIRKAKKIKNLHFWTGKIQ